MSIYARPIYARRILERRGLVDHSAVDGEAAVPLAVLDFGHGYPCCWTAMRRGSGTRSGCAARDELAVEPYSACGKTFLHALCRQAGGEQAVEHADVVGGGPAVGHNDITPRQADSPEPSVIASWL
jgi:hypothetical protein